MALQPELDRWYEPCDLCGGLDYEEAGETAGRSSLRCRTCGLVTLAKGPGPATTSHNIVRSVPTSLQKRLGNVPEGTFRSILVIGRLNNQFYSWARKNGVTVSELHPIGRQQPEQIAGVQSYTSDLASAPFLHDQFDAIILVEQIDALDSPAQLLKQARIWLVAGGSLFIGGSNSRGLDARLWKHKWLKWYAEGSRHLFSPAALRKYAGRYGFEVKSLDTLSTLDDTATVITGKARPAFIIGALLAPVTLVANMLNMGNYFRAELTNNAVAVRPILRPLKEEKRAQGLAPAMYSGVQRDAVVEPN